MLVSPIAVRSVEPSQRAVHVTLSMEQIRSSPVVDTNRPVARQHEVELHDYFGWPYYWVGALLWGIASLPTARPVPAPAAQASPRSRETPAPASERLVPSSEDPHLRSARSVIGQHVQGLDGEIGHVADLLVSPASNGWVSWLELTVHVNLDRATIRNGPAYDPSHPLSPDDDACRADQRGVRAR